jgi:hypothetical protein
MTQGKNIRYRDDVCPVYVPKNLLNAYSRTQYTVGDNIHLTRARCAAAEKST